MPDGRRRVFDTSMQNAAASRVFPSPRALPSIRPRSSATFGRSLPCGPCVAEAIAQVAFPTGSGGSGWERRAGQGRIRPRSRENVAPGLDSRQAIGRFNSNWSHWGWPPATFFWIPFFGGAEETPGCKILPVNGTIIKAEPSNFSESLGSLFVGSVPF